MNERAEAVLAYWFEGWDDGATPTTDAPQFRKWFGKSEEVDREIRDRFERLHLEAAAGELDGWIEEPRSAVALVILLDQLVRNMYRGTPRMYATDEKALAVTRGAITRGHERDLPLLYRMFLYMPLMHVEDRSAQALCCVKMAELVRLAEERSPAARDFFAMSEKYAGMHRDIVDRFGRFPHRNDILGRPSTPAEREFLQQPNSSF